jgi:hypothetical protein
MPNFKASYLDEATKIGTDDPTVRSGMLNIDVKMFWGIHRLNSFMGARHGTGNCAHRDFDRILLAHLFIGPAKAE